MSSSDFDAIDFFRARTLWQDPYPYYEYLRAHGPVWREPHHGVVMVTGLRRSDGGLQRPPRRSRRATRSPGRSREWPVPLEGDDISEIIEQYRDVLPFSDQLPSFDPPKHTAHRGLLMRLITPKRLKENEEFMWRLADRQIDEFLARGECEFVHDYANPFTLLVIADLLGVPEEDHETFREELQGDDAADARSAARWRTSRWSSSTSGSRRYIEDRRREPRDDVMTELATATVPRRHAAARSTTSC